MKIKVDLSGGLELLFSKKKEFELEFKEKEIQISNVIEEMTKLIGKNKEKKEETEKEIEQFAINENGNFNIKPGIVVLINDADWEIYDKEKTKVKDGDRISFISTLHGG